MADPVVSVIVPAYYSDATLDRMLQTLRQQTFKDFEVIVVDSTPGRDATAKMASEHPAVRYEHHPSRLLPHAARNQGVRRAKGNLLVFTDPDIYAAPDWLERLVGGAADDRTVNVGAVACYGRRWIDLGTHLCKFDSWLPGGPPRQVSICPTVNMLMHRSAYDSVGGVPGESMLGDTLLSWRLAQLGHALQFVPDAIVEHHHLDGFRDLLRERFTRGREFAGLRMEEGHWRPARVLLFLVVSVLPFRLAKIMLRTVANASRARVLVDLLLTLPVVLGGQAAWLVGESAAYWARLSGADANGA